MTPCTMIIHFPLVILDLFVYENNKNVHRILVLLYFVSVMFSELFWTIKLMECLVHCLFPFRQVPLSGLMLKSAVLKTIQEFIPSLITVKLKGISAQWALVNSLLQLCH